MKAAVLFKVNEPLVVAEVNLDPPKHGEVLVRIVASGICASDLHVMHGANFRPLPIILGHEGAGIVEDVGEGVPDIKKGDHVIISLAPACGSCFFLRQRQARTSVSACPTAARAPCSMAPSGCTRQARHLRK